MKFNRWLAAAAILGILTIAFFWGGNNQKSTQAPESTKPVVSASPRESNKPVISATPAAPATPTISASPTAQAMDVTKMDPPAETVPAPPVSEKDKYLTDPVPEGKPKPVEWQDATINKDKELSITLSVTAETILEHMDQFNQNKLEVLPEDGIIYKAQTVTFHEGESVFDVLLREMRKYKIHMEFEMTPIYNSNYVEGINNLYEFDCGELSGWMYKVNDWFPNYGSSRYVLQDGDVVEWVYTCDLGRDIGGDMVVTGEDKQ